LIDTLGRQRRVKVQFSRVVAAVNRLTPPDLDHKSDIKPAAAHPSTGALDQPLAKCRWQPSISCGRNITDDAALR
jgi:hypothetical protein